MRASPVEQTRKHFINTIHNGNPVHEFFPYHVEQVEKWALRILKFHPEADKEIVLLSVWLHDIGQANRGNHSIHEIISEKEARKFLPTIGLSQQKVDAVAQAVKTHRVKKGAIPATIEAKIIAAADSASHLTDIFYVIMLNQGLPKQELIDKIDRDLRDIQSLPKELLDQLTPLGDVWKQVVNAFPQK